MNVTYESYVFHQRIEQPGESVEDFVTDLRKLAKSCAFEQLEDSLIRDRLVVGIRDDPRRRRDRGTCPPQQRCWGRTVYYPPPKMLA